MKTKARQLNSENFKRHDRVYWFFNGTGKMLKYFGYVQKQLREIYFVIDDAGKEWAMYPEELRPVNTVSYNEIIKHVKNG